MTKNRTVKHKGLGSRLLKDKTLYLMLIPFIAFYVLFAYKPMYGLLMAFQDYSIFKGISGSEWIGLENFKTFLESEAFIRCLRNTLLINGYSLIFAFPVPIILALMLNELKNQTFKKTVQTMTYMPHFISTVVIVGIVTQFLAPSNGLVNILLDKFGFEKIYFLVEADYFRSIFISMNVWKEAGFNAIIYIAALAGINQDLYEAARMDGANRFKQMIHVTLPGILPTIMIMFILKLGQLLEVGAESIILLYQPATYETADVISTYVYRVGLQEGHHGLATAVGLFDSVIGLILVISANYLSKKYTQSSLW
ncbi:sugar ABC transporter permease [Paenibacillus swuensis]|uniref:Sugar ABC transporter permease n=1 Tax=Paenibacillus swuensis TaxID=1178515 RepID=A0A172TPS4_9BACL|nr:sugar ABC transporter permease [Paenibacillus swuensis]